jgi:Raf kinase inhibitor-like YbhB/YbcL family protein
MGRWVRVLLAVFLLALLTGCGSRGPGMASSTYAQSQAATTQIAEESIALEEEGAMLVLSSRAFSHGEMIPKQYTCDGQELSPPLEWQGAPAGTKSFALIMDDPDAPKTVFVHWVVYNIPASASSLPEGLPREPVLSDGIRQGENSAGRIGYFGPCPPSGVHRYSFRLYALDTVLNLDAGATKQELMRAMQGHILAQAELLGRYGRS